MRLSEDKARRLTALVWRERAKRVAISALVMLTVGAGAFAMMESRLGRLDKTVEVAMHEATVLEGHRLGNAPGAGVIHVHLDDGRDVDAFNTLRVLPAAGAHVVVSEARHASGKLTFDIMRLAQ